MLLLACLEEDFKCGTGECVKQYQLCDGHLDCQDESDEMNCPGTTSYIMC